MPGWKEILMDMLKLTDEVKSMNREIERLESYVVEVDNRLIPLVKIDHEKYQRAHIFTNNPAGHCR